MRSIGYVDDNTTCKSKDLTSEEEEEITKELEDKWK